MTDVRSYLHDRSCNETPSRRNLRVRSRAPSRGVIGTVTPTMALLEQASSGVSHLWQFLLVVRPLASSMRTCPSVIQQQRRTTVFLRAECNVWCQAIVSCWILVLRSFGPEQCRREVRWAASVWRSSSTRWFSLAHHLYVIDKLGVHGFIHDAWSKHDVRNCNDS